MNELENYLYDRYPNLDSIKKSIAYLSNLDLADRSIEYLRDTINKCFPILHYTEGFLSSDHHLFRVRRNLKNGFTPYNNLCCIGLPPVDKTPFGRANNEYDPVFYSSVKGDLALFESTQNLPEDQRYSPQNFTMGIWKVKKSETLRVATILGNESVWNVRSDLREVNSSLETLIDEKLANAEVKEGARLVSGFFADQFAKEAKTPHDYKISAFYSDSIRGMNKKSIIKFDGIAYPSIAYKYRSENVALFPESLHKIEVVKCCFVTSYNFRLELGECVKAVLADGSVLEGGEIKWINK